MKRSKELTVILFSLFLATAPLHGTLSVDAPLFDTVSGEQTWTYSPYSLDKFTIIVLPDTQYYSESYPDIFNSQTQWIVDNKETLKIVFVTHLGDIVDDWNDIEQWENANHSLSILNGNVPWGVLPGNHDGVSYDQTNFETYFGPDRFINESWYGGAYQSNNKNNYQLFSAGGDNYLILQLQYNPSDAILTWASEIIDSYPTRRVIVSTHSYIGWTISGAPRSNIGERIWQNLVRLHADQIFLVLCGHVDVEGHRTDIVEEYPVHQVVSDYQGSPNGGNGWLKILEFFPLQDKIFVKTYSPYLDEFHTDPNSMFTLDFDMMSTEANITVLSNSTVSDFTLDRSHNQIDFKVSGEAGTVGYCNVTIPQDLLLMPLLLQINEENQLCFHYRNATHTSLYFKYTHQDILQVTINGTASIPEFAPVIILTLFVIATLVAFVFSKRTIRAYRSMLT